MLIPIFDKRSPIAEKPRNKLKERKKRLGNNGRNNRAMKAQRKGIPMRSNKWNACLLKKSGTQWPMGCVEELATVK